MVWGIFLSKNDLKLSLLYTGTLIGAGFASGSEIAVYFLKSGDSFIIPLILSCGILILFGALAVKTAFKTRIFEYTEFMDEIMGIKASNIICFFTGVFFFVLFTAMISAFGSLCQSMGIMGNKLARIIFIFMCIPVLINGPKGIIKANSILVPVLVIGIVISSAAVLKSSGLQLLNLELNSSAEDFIKGAEFAFYNMVSCIPVLIECAGKLKEGTKPFAGCILTGVIVFLIGALMSCALVLSQNVLNEPLPMLLVTKNVSSLVYYIYIISFILSVYTTAASNGFCAMEWVLNKKFSVTKLVLFLAVSYLVSSVSFMVFVEKFYVVFSLIGLAEFVAIVIRVLKF